MEHKTYEYEDINPENNQPNQLNISLSLLEGVRSRRILAFLLDYLIVGVLTAAASIIIGILGVLTFGLGWALYVIVLPLIAIAYVSFTMGGPKQATVGMQFFAIKLITLDGKPIDPILAALHSILFWVLHVMATPLLLVASLFSSKKRLIQDWLLGTAIVRSDIA